METIIADYQRNVDSIFDRYMKLYVEACSGGMSTGSPWSFLLEHNDNYRKEVNAAAVQSIRNDHCVPHLIQRILELSDSNTGRLFQKIMEGAG